MAKDNYRTVISVGVNGKETQQFYKNLQRDWDQLIAKRNELRKANATGGKEYRDIEKRIESIKKQVYEWNDKQRNVKDVLTALNKVPLTNLIQAHKRAVTQLNEMERGTVDYAQKLREVKQLESEIDKNRRGSTLPKWVSYLGLATGINAVVGTLKRLGSEAVQIFAELDDKYADVMKTTGMTKAEVRELDEELKKIDTRTSRIELLNLAQTAGKLGITGKEDVAAFVRAADQLNVALGEDLGEGAIRQVGKLVDIFRIKDDLGLEKAMLSVGSAINTLGASSTANEGFIVDFATDLAGTAPAADIAIESVLGYASTLDSLGQRSKKSATAVSKAIRGMFTDTAKYAKIAGMELPDFKKLLEENANEAFLKFLEGANSDLGNMAKSLESVGLTGAEAQAVLGALAGNVETIRQQQEISNKSFSEANSIQEEYNTKNESAQAKLEKRKKKLQEIYATLGEKLMPMWSNAIRFIGKTSQLLVTLFSWLYKYRSVILSVAGAVVAYNTAVKIKLLLQKQSITWGKLHNLTIQQTVVHYGRATTGAKLLGAAKLLLAGNVKAAGAAFKIFWKSIGPIGWIVGIVGALATTVSLLTSKERELTEAQKAKNRIQEKVIEDYGVEEAKVERLMRIIHDSTASYDARKRALEELRDIAPDYHAELTEEGELINDNTDAIERYLIAKKKEIYLNATKEEWEELIPKQRAKKKDVQVAQDNYDTVNKYYANGGSDVSYTRGGMMAGLDVGMSSSTSEKNRVADILEAETEELTELNTAIADLEAEMAEIEATMPTIEEDDDDDGGGDGDDDKTKWSLEKDKGFLTARAELRRQLTAGELADEQEYNDKVLQLEIDTFKARMKLLGEGHEDYAKLNADLNDKLYQQQKNETTRTEKLLQASFEGAGKQDINLLFDKEKTAYEKRLKELGLFGKKREDMTDVELAAALALEKQYNQNLSRIYAEGMQDRWNELKTRFEDEQAFLRERNMDELSVADTLEKKKTLIAKYYGDDRAAQVKTNAQALKLLNEYYRRTEAKQQAVQLEQLLAEYQKQMDELVNIRESTGGLLPELDETQIKNLQAIIRKLKEDLAKLNGQAMGDEEFAEDGKEESKLDFLGYSKEDWTEFFKNLDTGWDKLDKWKMAVELISNAWGEVNNLMKAVGEREIANLEKTTEDKKKALDEQLQQGIISQETYNQRVQELDEETEAKKREILRQQAIREKALAIFSAVINTALGVVEAAPVVPLMIAIGALGALQIAAIAAQPLPQLAEGGALVDVLGADDKKRYRAKYAPKKRGWVKEPTVLTGENGSEYVIPHDAMGNPTIRPMIDILEMARRSGSLSTINLPAIYEAEQYARGGFVSTPTRSTAPTADVSTTAAPSATGYDFSCIEAQLAENREVNARLLAAIERGIFARVDYYGRGGIKEVTDRATRIENSATIKPRPRTKTK